MINFYVYNIKALIPSLVSIFIHQCPSFPSTPQLNSMADTFPFSLCVYTPSLSCIGTPNLASAFTSNVIVLEVTEYTRCASSVMCTISFLFRNLYPLLIPLLLLFIFFLIVLFFSLHSRIIPKDRIYNYVAPYNLYDLWFLHFLALCVSFLC